MQKFSTLYFDKQPVQTDIIKSYIADYFPISSLGSSSPIEFHIPGNSEDYIDVNDLYLQIMFKVINRDGTYIEDTDKVG